MTDKDKFYITTTLPYVNADPHMGFALEMVQADVTARYHALLGQEVFFNTGTDEHGLKIFRNAQAAGKDPQSYTDEFAEKFKQLMPALGIWPEIHFIRTTDQHHIKACQEFWNRCFDKGDIYKKIYNIKYCVGCELEKTESELNEDGRCLLHPNLEIEIIEEENYFFRLSRYQKPLLEFYEKNPEFVVPDFRFNEIKQFVKSGLQDFSISRLKEKMSWGVPVPENESQVMYVWFDALINYISTLGWPENESKFTEFWGTQENPKALQIAGKDNLRQQSAMWQAMLMSAGLPNSRQIIIHGFINSAGQKMSKSLGNVIDPYQILSQLQGKGLTSEQAIDALRYYLIREIPTFEDGDFTWEKFVEAYNANLANGLGNLVSRIMKMAVTAGVKFNVQNVPVQNYPELDGYNIQKFADKIWQRISTLDEYIQKTQPFKVIKTDPEKAKKDIEYLLEQLNIVGLQLAALLPVSSEKILQTLKDSKEDKIPRPFPRLES